MAINPFMNPGALIGSPTEKKLLDDLHVEAIQIHGMDVLYLPRTSGKLDMIYLEDTQVEYNAAIQIEMYLRSFDSFQGDSDFMSQLGAEIRDQVVFSVSMTRWEEEFGERTPYKLFRPREGDLIWYPLNKKLFEISYVNKFQMHYPLGSLYLWELRAELIEYSGQKFATGVAEIDDMMNDLSQSTDNANGYVDPLDDRDRIAQEAEDILLFDELDIWTETKYGVKDKS